MKLFFMLTLFFTCVFALASMAKCPSSGALSTFDQSQYEKIAARTAALDQQSALDSMKSELDQLQARQTSIANRSDDDSGHRLTALGVAQDQIQKIYDDAVKKTQTKPADPEYVLYDVLQAQREARKIYDEAILATAE